VNRPGADPACLLCSPTRPGASGGIEDQQPLQMLLIFASTLRSSSFIKPLSCHVLEGPVAAVPDVAGLPPEFALPAELARPTEFAVPREFVPGGLGIEPDGTVGLV